jgi:hypothetical protein
MAMAIATAMVTAGATALFQIGCLSCRRFRLETRDDTTADGWVEGEGGISEVQILHPTDQSTIYFIRTSSRTHRTILCLLAVI